MLLLSPLHITIFWYKTLTPTIMPTGRKSRDCVPKIHGVSKPKAKTLNSLAPNPDFTVC